MRVTSRPHVALRAPRYAAAVCAGAYAPSCTSASAWRSTRASASGFTPSVARWRRNARARHRVEQAEDVAQHRVEPRAAGGLALDVRDESLGRFLGRTERRGRAEQHGIDIEQAPRLLVGSAPHHDAVDMREVLAGSRK